MLRFEIRPARNADFPGIVRLLNAYAEEPLAPGSFTRWEMTRLLDSGYQRVVAVTPDNVVIATGVVRVGIGFEAGNALIQVMVSPVCFHQGVGQMLHAVLERWAVEQGATHLVVVIKEDGAERRFKRTWRGPAPLASMLPAWAPAGESERERQTVTASLS